jgi:hypothetical protein
MQVWPEIRRASAVFEFILSLFFTRVVGDPRKLGLLRWRLVLQVDLCEFKRLPVDPLLDSWRSRWSPSLCVFAGVHARGSSTFAGVRQPAPFRYRHELSVIREHNEVDTTAVLQLLAPAFLDCRLDESLRDRV